MTATAIELLRQGRKHQIWTKYCGFLDLSLKEFMQIQERLLLEQFDLLSKSELGRYLLRGKIPGSIEEFRARIPITTYDDYEPYLGEDKGYFQNAYVWAHTSGRSGKYKWIPYTREAYERLGERVLAGVILGAAREKGEVRLEEGDVLVYNTPPRPYISGITLRALAEQFNFRFVPALDETEAMGFQERIEAGFREGMKTGIDILGSMSAVLVKMGEAFTSGARKTRISRQMLHPQVLFRLIRGYIRAKMEGRNMLPRDLWTLKGAMAGGTDTSIYRAQLATYWGVEVHEQYGSTEFGIMATQAWDRRGMYFLPDIAFYEFIPPDEWERSRQDPAYQPRTLLLSETRPGERYEIVMTSLHSDPFLRYRLHDLVQFTAPEERDPSIALPSFTIKGRTMDLIDLAGFTGVIDEQSAWRALAATGLELAEWSLRKEVERDRPVLHLYIELKAPASADEVHRRLDAELRASNPFYSDIEKLLGYNPLRVTVLPRETFLRYMRKQQEAGADLSHLKPPHLNASDAVIAQLKEIAATLA
uniref:GH3 auxin-responsive promoter n=1 Tax=Anaerolinea thermolimosa TaxID=229919 RepID=A0A7C4PRL8_9CHLR